MYALIFLVFVQGAQSLTPVLTRFELEPGALGQPFKTLDACRKAGSLLVGPVFQETDPAVQYVWRDFVCKKVT
jgi:hypothetical protein